MFAHVHTYRHQIRIIKNSLNEAGSYNLNEYHNNCANFVLLGLSVHFHITREVYKIFCSHFISLLELIGLRVDSLLKVIEKRLILLLLCFYWGYSSISISFISHHHSHFIYAIADIFVHYGKHFTSMQSREVMIEWTQLAQEISPNMFEIWNKKENYFHCECLWMS